MNLRKLIIRTVTFLSGLYFFLEFLLPAAISLPGVEGAFSFGRYHQKINTGFLVIGTMAIGLGVLNILIVHGSRAAYRRRGWAYSLVLLGALFAMMSVTWLDWRATSANADYVSRINTLREFSARINRDAAENVTTVKSKVERNEILARELRLMSADVRGRFDIAHSVPSASLEAKRLETLRREIVAGLAKLDGSIAKLSSRAATETSKVNEEVGTDLSALTQPIRESLTLQYQRSPLFLAYKILYDGLFVSLGAAMFSLLGFYIAAAAYRAFRVRSTESALMMTAAVIVMLGQIPFGLWIWDGLPAVRLWLLEIPNAAAFRAIKFGAAIAGLVIAYRMWCSIESESFSKAKSE